jgi:hypothetical protein
MAELVDAPASGAGARKGVEVRVLSWAPLFFAFGVKELSIDNELHGIRFDTAV